MLQRLGIRGKLLAVVAVPILALLLAVGIIVSTTVSDLGAARDEQQFISGLDAARALETDLQVERQASVNYVNSVDVGRTSLSTAQADVASDLATLEDYAASLNNRAANSIVTQVYDALGGKNGATILTELRSLAIVPGSEDEFATFPAAEDVTAMVTGYQAVVAQLNDAAAASDPALGLDTFVRGLAFQVGAEGTAAQTLFTEPLDYQQQLVTSFPAVDRGVELFTIATADIAANSDNARVLATFAGVRTVAEDLPALRDRLRAGTASVVSTLQLYTELIDSIDGASSDVTSVTSDAQVVSLLQAYSTSQALIEAMRYEGVVIERLIRTGAFVSGEADQLRATVTRTDIALQSAQRATEGIDGIRPTPDFGASEAFTRVRQNVLNGLDSALIIVRSSNWTTQVDEELAIQTPLADNVWANVKQGVEADAQSALVATIVATAIGALIVISSLVIALLIARRIINPLRRLTTTATAVRQELPRLVERVAMPGQSVDISEVQIPVESQDEVGRLAEAFNSVNAATLAIASEQAALRGSISEMFVNVARRDQVLLNRQLSSIDEMERTEDNQTTLTKLFALDHLATRMRRNSESLLVLAGIDTGRRLRRSMPLSDVIRTASSEIELYERVQLELDADPSMLGHSALTAAHLFAELLENATVFSDPGTPVVVRTMTEGDNICVEVVDYGIGMTPEELGEANARVASTAASEILGAQRLGLFVVGRIARRVGARVQLESIEGGGICARVVMPPSLFDATATYEQGHQSSTATDESTHAPAALVRHSVSDAEVRDPIPTLEQRPIAAQHGYQPTIIEGGAGLEGRTVEPPATAEAFAVLPDRASSGIESLVAADAASAPEAIPVDLGALTDGATLNGLPTRRRKSGDAGIEAPQETNSIIGLPMRASDEQLTALESAATSGFTPILAAGEVSPESAEQRARVFRGFRPLRSDDAEPAMLAPDAESFGHAVRRGAPVADILGEPAEPTVIPSLELDAEETSAASAAEHAPNQGQSAAPDQVVAQEPEAPFAVQSADPRHSESPVVRQSPLIATGFTGEDEDSAPAGPTPSMAIPMLEEDEPEPSQSRPWSQPGESQSAGVDSVGLDGDPYAHAPEPQPQGENGMSAAPGAQAEPVFRSPLYPTVPQAEEPAAQGPFGASAGDWRQGSQGQSPQFESDPVTSMPSLDELISDGSHSEGAEDRGGFFSRVFGKGRKQEAPPEENAFIPPDTVAPAAGAPAFPAPLGGPVGVSSVPTPTWQGSVPSTTLYEDQRQSTAEPQSGEFPAPPPEAPRQREDRSQWIGQAPAAALSEPEGFAPQSAPNGNLSEFTPDPTHNEPVDADWSLLGRTTAQDSADSHAVFGPGGVPAMYSPDQLARPLGWEAAGESALQAAAPEAATEYRPVVQVEAQEEGGGSVDFTSEVFSELSSLAAERPKVEKTRAGLVKRTPVEREAEPEASADVAAPEVPRDAEAVRNRFLSFYSGTQRARDDVKSFNDSTQGSLTES